MLNVKENRNAYIGGSDIATIMGLSSFKTRWQLLKEKAGFEKDTFEGNIYTEYGIKMEGKIRQHLDKLSETKFKENRTVVDDMRYHSDGVDDETVIEIKTTSREGAVPSDFKDYIVQLLFGMELNNKEKGILAVYKRPEDFNEDFNSERLLVFRVSIKDYQLLLNEIFEGLDKFRTDLKKLKNNPLLTEHDLQPNEVQVIAHKVVELEKKLVSFKELEKQHKSMKNELYEAMTKNDIKSWELPNGTRITRVAQGKEEEVATFQESDFKLAHPDLHDEFLKTQFKKGRAGYVKIKL